MIQQLLHTPRVQSAIATARLHTQTLRGREKGDHAQVRGARMREAMSEQGEVVWRCCDALAAVSVACAEVP